MHTLKIPERLRFCFSVTTPQGGGWLGAAHGVNAALVEGLNAARFSLGADPTRASVRLTVEVVCDVCGGEGRIAKAKRISPCPSCKGGTLTHPISGPLALVVDVYREGGFSYPDHGRHCECEADHREGVAGATCQRCGHFIREA